MESNIRIGCSDREVYFMKYNEKKSDEEIIEVIKSRGGSDEFIAECLPGIIGSKKSNEQGEKKEVQTTGKAGNRLSTAGWLLGAAEE